jgi:hypothetical protein
MAEVTVTVRIKDDPDEYAASPAGVSLYTDIAERPVLSVRHTQVDACRVGEVVLSLLRAATTDELAGGKG